MKLVDEEKAAERFSAYLFDGRYPLEYQTDFDTSDYPGYQGEVDIQYIRAFAHSPCMKLVNDPH